MSRCGCCAGLFPRRRAGAGRGIGPAEDCSPPDRPIEEVVDHYVDARLAEAGVKAGPEADDATLVRRLTLDLVGRIPTAAEVRAYVESTDPDKRAKLVDRLMASPGFVRHQADSFDAMLMAGRPGEPPRVPRRAPSARVGPGTRSSASCSSADESEPARKGSAEFLKARAKDLDRLTSDVSSVFFGVNVSCAKCHDHPLVEDWKQDHFYGMKSFLGRTFEAATSWASATTASVKFKTTEGEEKQAKFMFLTGRVVEVPGAEEPSKEAKKEEKRRLDEAKKKKGRRPPPKVSARAKLVEVALEPGERDFFARSIVNRLWHRFFGVGPGDAARPDALGEPAEPPRAARLAGPRH